MAHHRRRGDLRHIACPLHGLRGHTPTGVLSVRAASSSTVAAKPAAALLVTSFKAYREGKVGSSSAKWPVAGPTNLRSLPCDRRGTMEAMVVISARFTCQGSGPHDQY